MVRTTGLVAAFSAAALLAACSTPEPTPVSSNAHNQALSAGYEQLSADEQAEYDWRDSRHFASKSVAAGSDATVEPDTLESRKIPADYQDELSAARVRLVAAYGQGAVDAAPVEVATAQVMFDCWMQEREENHQEFDIGRCESGYQEAMAQVDAILVGDAGPYNVFFDFDNASLSGDAEALLATIMSDINKRPGAKVVVSGHTDTVGPADYNFALSEERAAAVAAYLTANGVPEDAIVTRASGKTGLLVPTADGVRNAQNRRANILLQ